ncbi:MAG: membrane protein insertion efficiency factor YidD [SAR202 cluster bacterium]|nr:membrane protein insertion efficiency factor YidD [Dehalococcoidia bacterium]MQG25734.1 membrane protein insertion efficiency factor YidD [SAR202 cluster bacterium]MQG53228.1 membrane protein insertion efficiency factor YidD [SAR202 cluster bacterium]MQG60384.1 membrane protein insertion efficiency factor YidD [SAR202 cluster bacterium]
MKSLLLVPIKMYQKCISPYLPSVCRFTPTCSEYAYQSIEEYGVLKGSFKAILRISKCNPLGSKGYDPAK